MRGSHGCVGLQRGTKKSLLIDGHSITIVEQVPEMGPDPGSRSNDSSQIEGIGSGNANNLSPGLAAAEASEGIDGLGQGKLLAHKSGDKSSSSNLSLSFHPAVNGQQVAPGQSQTLSSQQIAKNHAPTHQ
jgi:hypothetical protein